MKRSLIILSLLALSGCAGLNVSWQMTASYNTTLQTRSLTEHGLADVAPVQPVVVPPTPIPPGKPS